MTHNNFNHRKWSYLFFKRVFDITISSIALLLLSPVLVIVAILIKLESSGPIFYTSLRVGRNYRTFRFYKFRSMRIDADSMIEVMKNFNQYSQADSYREVVISQPVPMKIVNGEVAPAPRERMLISDEGWINEAEWVANNFANEEDIFMKIPNDPRVTRIGRFIRNTSIDELPQLFNVLKGDMSIVGNRPLPPYEAERLTTDTDVERFFAPAGITGLWQVTERGKKNMNSNSRKQLDVMYAQTCSMGLDFWILLKTPFAVFQTENV